MMGLYKTFLMFTACFQLKYTFLYILHTDFNFVPCSIFELSYKNLLKV